MRPSSHSREIARLILSALVVGTLASIAGWLLMVEHEADYERELARLAPVYVRTQDTQVSRKE